MSVRVAWFVMVHHKPDQLAWLLNALDDPADLIIVHVDLKSRLGLKRGRRGLMAAVQRLCAGRQNIVFLPSRFTNWGGWSLSRALLDAMRLALNFDPSWTHFVNLSGQCYPLKPLAQIRREIAETGEGLMVELRSLDGLPEDDWHLRWHPMLELPLRAIRLPGRRRPPGDFELTHKGSQWVVLPRSFCRWALDAPVTRSVIAYLRRLLLSDELIIQTLARNGPFSDRVLPYRRYIVWPGPRTLTFDDLPAIRASDAWFGRKFDQAVDSGVLVELALRNGSTPGPVASVS